MNAIDAAGELRLAAQAAEKQRQQEEQQEALRQRKEARQQEDHERLRRMARSNFVGTDEQFDQAWPAILERIVTQEVMQAAAPPTTFLRLYGCCTAVNFRSRP